MVAVKSLVPSPPRAARVGLRSRGRGVRRRAPGWRGRERKKIVSKRGEGSSDTMELFPTTAYHAMRDIKGREGGKKKKKKGRKERAEIIIRPIYCFKYHNREVFLLYRY